MTNNESTVPRDAKVISLILRSLGIEHCEPKVIIQLLEFAYKYSTDVLSDALVYAEHCGRKNITTSDVKLSLQTKVGKYFVSPPPRQYMHDIALAVNSKPLQTYESENLVKLPNSKMAFLNLEYENVDKKKRNI